MFIVFSLSVNAATEFKLSRVNVTMGVKEYYYIDSLFNGKTVTSSAVYKSSNPSVVNITSDNKIYALKTGTATVTASYNGFTAKCTITVKPMATSVTLNETTLTIGVGETFNLNGQEVPRL